MITASIVLALIVSMLLICLDQLIKARIGVIYEKSTRTSIHAPILVEEFLKDLEELIMNVLDSRTSLEELSGWIDQSRELLQDPLLDDADAREKLDQLIDYLKPTVELPKERALKRLTNALGMIERYRSWHFFAKPDPSQAKQLSLDIKSARGVGPRREKLLRKLEINSLRDLVFYFPRDYEDRRRVISLKDLLLGEKVTTRGKISSVEMKSVSGMKIVAAVLADGIHHVLLKWFNQEFIYRQLQTLKGKEVYVTGTVKKGMFGGLEIVNPEVELVENSSALEILPVYPLTEGMSQKEFRRIVRQNIDCVAIVQDELPLELTERRKLIDLAIALYGMHFPKTTYQLEKVQRETRIRRTALSTTCDAAFETRVGFHRWRGEEDRRKTCARVFEESSL